MLSNSVTVLGSYFQAFNKLCFMDSAQDIVSICIVQYQVLSLPLKMKSCEAQSTDLCELF